MRTLLLELRPSALFEAPLPDLLNQLREAALGRCHTVITFAAEGRPIVLPSRVQEAVYRLAQESLNNVVKHAAARTATISLTWLEDGVTLEITDDGRGFDPARVAPGHMGLGIMQERASAVGGRLNVDSQVGEGTRVRFEWRRPASD